MFQYMNPSKFILLSQTINKFLWLSVVVFFVFGLYMVFSAPADYQQGETVRIMFIHVPSAWMSLFVYVFLTLASFLALIFRQPFGYSVARAAAPIGCAFTCITLLTGAFWGQPIWGTWWVWDARLTSVLILLFIYFGYMAIWQVIEDPLHAGRIASIVALVGFVNVPIVKFSVDWWHTLHQPASVSRWDTPALHADFLWPLLVMAIAFHLLFVVLWFTRMHAEILRQRLYVRRLNLSEEEF